MVILHQKLNNVNSFSPAAQGDRMKKSGEFVENNISQEAIVKRASETLSFKAELNRCKRFIQICSNMAKNSKILSTVINPHTAMILIKAHIKTPMQTIFNAPVLTNRFCKEFNICNR